MPVVLSSGIKRAAPGASYRFKVQGIIDAAQGMRRNPARRPLEETWASPVRVGGGGRAFCTPGRSLRVLRRRYHDCSLLLLGGVVATAEARKPQAVMAGQTCRLTRPVPCAVAVLPVQGAQVGHGRRSAS